MQRLRPADSLSCMVEEPTTWQLKVGRVLSRWFIFLPLIILLSLAIYGKCLDDFPVPVAFVHFFPFSLGALFDQVWNGQWNFCRPTAMLIWRLGYALFENNYIGYNFILFFLHLTNVYLVLVFARRMLKNDLAAALSGLLFAAHPIHSEVVCLLASMYDASCLTFFLATMIAFDRYIESSLEQGRRSARLLCLLTCVFEVLCLGAKEIGIVLPLVMLAYDMFLHVKRPKLAASLAAAIKRSLPFLAILAGYLVFRLTRYEQNVGYAGEFLRDPVGTLQNLIEYLRLTLFPNEMWVVLLIFLPFAKRRYLFSLLFMLLTIVPVLRIPPAERFCYIPSVGYCMAVAWCFVIGWSRVWEKFGVSMRWLAALGPVAAIGVFVLQIPFAYLNTCTWSDNYIPVRKTLQSIREVVGIPEPGTVLYFANIDPLFDLSLLNGYDCTTKDRFRCERLINYLFEDHRGPEFVFSLEGREVAPNPEVAARCRQLESQLGRQKYRPPSLVWGQGGRFLSEWTIMSGDSGLAETVNAARRGTDATVSFDLSRGPIKLLSPVLNFSTLDVTSVTLVGNIEQPSGETTCQLEWVVLPKREVISNSPTVIPVYNETKPSAELSASWWQRARPKYKKRAERVNIDLGSRTDWLFERRLIERIAVKLTGSGHVTVETIQLDPPAPSRTLDLVYGIQFREHR